MAGAYELFKTDENLETKGVNLNYGDFSIRVARAGGANKKYAKVFEAKIRPFRRAIQTDTMDPEVDRRIMAEVYAETVIIGWKGMKGQDGKELAFNKANVVKVLTDLPDLFADIIGQANQVSVFRADEAEVDAKN